MCSACDIEVQNDPAREVKIELSSKPLGYVLRVSAVELGHVQAGLIDLANFYERLANGDEWFLKQAAEVRALHAAIDPTNV